MKNITSVLLLAILMVISIVQAKNGTKRPVFHPIGDRPTDAEIVRQSLINTAHAEHKVDSPIVEAPKDAQYECIFQDDQNEWCFVTTSPILKVGWDWAATTPTDAFLLEFKPYFTTQATLSSKMILDRLFKHTIALSLNQFQVNFVNSFLFGQTGQVCLGFGWESQAIIGKLQTQFDFQECTKTMIQDLCSWNDTFIGEKAKWIDECKSSSTASSITLRDWQLATAMTDFILVGGEKLNGDGCIRFATWSSWAPYLAQAAVV